MNEFANSLLHLLLSWMRALFGDFLTFFQDGSSGFLAWISKHWILLAVLLVAAGIILDAIIYMIRWRPQRVWKTGFRRIFHRGDDADFDEREFNAGFDTALPDYDFGDTPIPDLQPLPENDSLIDSYYEQPANPPVYQEEIHLPGEETNAMERKRRSDRHAKGLRTRLSDHALVPSRRKKPEAPPDIRSAFHHPVYPAGDNPYSASDVGGDEQDV